MTRIWIILAGLLLGSIFVQAVEPDTTTLPLKERVEVASKIYGDIQMFFGHWQSIPEFDLDAAYSTYLDAVLANDSRKEFDLATMEFMAKLQNGHSGFRDGWLQDNYGQQLNFYADPIDGQWTVTRSALPDLKAGDVLATLDGEPLQSFYLNHRKYIAASDERWRQRAFFEYSYLFPEDFQLTLADGRRVAVHRRGAFQFAGAENTKISVTNREGVVVIRVPGFHVASLEADALEALKQASAARAVIIDVRGNHGGTTPEKLINALMDRPYRWWSESTPAHIGTFRVESSAGTHTELHWFGGVEQPAEPLYKGPLFLLIDGGCYSACEDFVVPFKDNHRATLIGERTGGSSGQPYSHRFKNGMRFGLSTKREFMPDGSPFEGVGIAPDIEVVFRGADLVTGRDPALDRALSMASSAKPR